MSTIPVPCLLCLKYCSDEQMNKAVLQDKSAVTRCLGFHIRVVGANGGLEFLSMFVFTNFS